MPSIFKFIFIGSSEVKSIAIPLGKLSSSSYFDYNYLIIN